jgi:hypothetical protein
MARTPAIFLCLLAYFSVWALIRPPGQGPDESHHLAKLLSVRQQPWLASPDRVTIPQADASPFAGETVPAALAKLPFNPDARLTAGEIGSLRSTPAPEAPGPPTWRTQAAGYPTPSYWLLWIVGRGLTSAVGRIAPLTPYQEFFAWRLAASASGAVLWTALLWMGWRRVGLPAYRYGLWLLAANPMTPFVTSTIGPDAIQLPLAMIAVGLFARCMTSGRNLPILFACALATALASPRGLLVLPALAVAAAAVAAIHPGTRRAAAGVLAALAGAACVAWATFYRFGTAAVFGVGTTGDESFVMALLARLPALWRQLWGKLGWLDYALPHWWYIGLTLLLLANLHARRRGAAGPGQAVGVAAFSVVFPPIVAGALWWKLPNAAMMLQGRYFLPSVAGFGSWLDHDRPWLRAGLFGWLIGMNVAFVQATVVRYFADGWGGLWASLPI